MAAVVEKNPQQIKVMRIIARLNVGGPALHCDLLSKGLGQHGYETVLVTGTTEPGEASYETVFQMKAENYRLVKLPKLRRLLNPFGDLKTLFALYSLMRTERPNIVHTHTAKAGTLGRIAAKMAGVPVVVHTFHGHVLHGYFPNWFSKCVQLLERALASQSSAIVTLSPALKEELSGRFKIAKPSRFHIIPLGRDLKPFLEMPRFNGKLRKSLGLGSDAILLGIIGRLVPIKAHSLLFNALAKMQTTANWHLAVIGEGDLGESLKEEAKRLNIADRVHFLGWRSDLSDIYSDLDFSVLSSLNEGTPLSIIESFGAGCPVVSTDVGGVKDMFTPEASSGAVQQMKEGILVPPSDARLLAEALKYFIENQDVRERASLNARERALGYTDRALVERVHALYTLLLSQAKKGASA